MKKKKEETSSGLGALLSSMAFAMVLTLLAPKLIEKGSSYLYKKQKPTIPNTNIDDDNWGAEIVKKGE